jgi:hypothetical protein
LSSGDLGEGPTENRLQRAAGELDVFLIDVAVAALAVQQGNARGNVVEQHAELRFTGGETGHAHPFRTKIYPEPCTVLMTCGLAGSGSTLRGARTV